MSKISFSSANIYNNLKNRKAVKSFLLNIFDREGKDLDHLHYIFCSDSYLLEINNKFLNHDYYTDIITFQISPQKQPIQAELYISLNRIKENAKLYSVLYQNELLRVMIHGILHLCGYDDKTKDQKDSMRQKENFYLEVFNDVPREK